MPTLTMSVTSLAVVCFFRRHAEASLLVSWVMPVMSGLVMAVLFVYIFFNFGDLTGTQGGSLGIVLPSLIPLAALVGCLLAGRLKAANPKAYANMGASRT